MRLLSAFLFAILLCASNAYAITIPGAAATSAPAAATVPAEEAPKDELERDSPRSTVAGLVDALNDKNYELAAKYLDLSGLSRSQQKNGPQLAEKLHQLLDLSGWLRPASNLSDLANGVEDDNLPPEIERVGGIRTEKRTVPILLEHKTPEKAASYWVITSDTVLLIPQLEKEARESLLNKYLPEYFKKHQIKGVPIGHWLSLIVTTIAAYAIIWLLSSGLLIIFCKARKRISSVEYKADLAHAFLRPLQLFFSVWLAFFIIRQLGIAFLARQVFFQLAQVAVWVSFAWMLWRLIDVFAEMLKRRLISRGQYSVLSAIVFLRRGAKFTLAIILGITVLDSFGFQVTTWLAALGIGGIALALGAQKTVENFVGSLTLIADRPIAIGETCKFGSTIGTVEDIGMRSTRIRTPDKTVITIPNGEFATMQIENYSRRYNFFYNPKINVRYETTPEQLRKVMDSLRAMLKNHEKVEKVGSRVNFIEFGTSALIIELAAVISTSNADDFNNIKEDLNLKVMEILRDEEVRFSFPSQTIYMEKSPEGGE